MNFIIIVVTTLIIIAIIIAYLVDDKVKSEKSINKKTGIKSLGNIPLNIGNSSLMIENDPKANMMSYIKAVRTNILEATNEQSILIMSANNGEGKSWIANNIAISLARINKKVLLIDANLAKASNKSEIFYTENGEGLSNFIIDIKLDDKLGNLYKSKKYIRQTQIPNLYILPSGAITVNSSELVKSKKMKELLKLLKEMYDYIILDGTAFFEDSNFIDLSILADTSILVVEENKTRYKDLIILKEELDCNNVDILGFILNKTNIRRGKYYAKNSRKRYGIYIETLKEENKNIATLDEIISPIANQMKEDKPTKFDELHKEIKENILIEDFINDIEVNFNLKIDNIEKNNKENIEVLLEKITQTEEFINEKINTYNFKREEDIKDYENFSGYIVKELKILKNEISKLKIEQEEERNEYFKQIIKEIQNNNYDEQFEKIREQLEENNYDEQLEEIKNKIKNIETKNLEENKRNNIIDLGRMFIENRKNNNSRVFSIDQPIDYEDLERLAVEVIEFDETEDTMYNYFSL